MKKFTLEYFFCDFFEGLHSWAAIFAYESKFSFNRRHFFYCLVSQNSTASPPWDRRLRLIAQFRWNRDGVREI